MMRRDDVYRRLVAVGASKGTATLYAVTMTNDAPKAIRRKRHMQEIKHKEAA